MQAAQQKVLMCEKELQEVERKLEQAKTELADAQRAPFNVKAQLSEQVLASQESDQIRVSGSAFEPFVIPGRTYCIGTCDVPRELFAAGSCLDLSFMIPGVFHEQGANILEQVGSFFFHKWEEMRKYDFFYFPVHTMMHAQGRKKTDLPNVCFAVTILMLQNEVEFIVADPLHKGVDPTVRVINFSAVYRNLVATRCKVQTGFSQNRGLSVVFYQRGTGNPDQKTYAAIEAASGMTRQGVMHCHLTPGKYEKVHGENCYRDFKRSAAILLHQFSLIDPYSRAKDENYLRNLYFVLDEFSAYAGYTAAAILGYGIKDVSSVLAFRQGVYTPMKC